MPEVAGRVSGLALKFEGELEMGTENHHRTGDPHRGPRQSHRPHRTTTARSSRLSSTSTSSAASRSSAKGRMFFEMPLITARICGICPVSHHLASAKACDQIIGAEPPRPAKLLRELMHMGQIIQSHSMHFFELAGPDLLLGFEPTRRSATWWALSGQPGAGRQGRQAAQVRPGDHRRAGRPPHPSALRRARRRQPDPVVAPTATRCSARSTR